MSGKKLLLLALIVLSLGCGKKVQTDSGDDGPCPALVCSLDYRSIGFTFVDKTGQPIAVESFSAVNKRTGLPLTNTGPTNAGPGYYIIATDSNLKEIATGGDDLLISGVNPSGRQFKSAVVRVTGGCGCHISKVSGPSQIQFD